MPPLPLPEVRVGNTSALKEPGLHSRFSYIERKILKGTECRIRPCIYCQLKSPEHGFWISSSLDPCGCGRDPGELWHLESRDSWKLSHFGGISENWTFLTKGVVNLSDRTETWWLRSRLRRREPGEPREGVSRGRRHHSSTGRRSASLSWAAPGQFCSWAGGAAEGMATTSTCP